MKKSLPIRSWRKRCDVQEVVPDHIRAEIWQKIHRLMKRASLAELPLLLSIEVLGTESFQGRVSWPTIRSFPIHLDNNMPQWFASKALSIDKCLGCIRPESLSYTLSFTRLRHFPGL
jgi:hypothetical protein